MSLVESVEDIVVSALARQDRFARNDGIHMTPEKAAALRVGDWPMEPDSGVVTRDIINAMADELGNAGDDLTAFSQMEVPDWLRSQANPDSEESEK